MALGEIIKDYRKQHGMSMEDFAAVSGISKAYISVLENNRRAGTNEPVTPTIETVYKAAMAMETDAEKLCAVLISEMKEKKESKEIRLKQVIAQLSNEDFLKWIGFGEGLLHSQQMYGKE